MGNRQVVTQTRTYGSRALMLEGPLAEGRMDVFIFEIDHFRSSKRFLWDAKADSVMAEINMSILTKTLATGDEQLLGQDIT